MERAVFGPAGITTQLNKNMRQETKLFSLFVFCLSLIVIILHSVMRKSMMISLLGRKQVKVGNLESWRSLRWMYSIKWSKVKSLCSTHGYYIKDEAEGRSDGDSV